MRTKYSIINMLVSVGGQIPNLVLAFLARAVFVRCLSAEYLGVNGLFFQSAGNFVSGRAGNRLSYVLQPL